MLTRSARPRHLYAGLSLLTLAALAVLPRNAAALTAVVVLCVWVVGILVFRRTEPSEMADLDPRFVAILAAPVVFIVLRSAVATNPRVSLLGGVGQHAGSLLWVVVLALLLVSMFSSSRADVGRLMRSISLLGAALAVSGMLDSWGLLGAARFSEQPAGLMENSLSLGQVLVVTLPCAVAWFLVERRDWRRIIPLAAAIVCVAGLVVVDSAAAWLGVVVGGVLALALAFIARRGRLHPRRTAVFLVIANLVILASLWAYTSGPLSQSGAARAMDSASNNRFTIWQSALAQAQQSPLVGSGAEQFSAWVEWSVDSASGVEKTSTYDPHDMLLWWLLAGGLIGLSFALVAIGAVLMACAMALDQVPSPPTTAVLSAVLGLGVAALFSWSSPLALGLLACLTGSMLGSLAPRCSSAVSRRVSLLSGVTVVIVAGLLLGMGGIAEYRWFRLVDSVSVDAGVLRDIATRTMDPAYTSFVVPDLLYSTGAPSVELDSFVPELRRDSEWHVDAALARLSMAVSTPDEAVTAGIGGIDDAVIAGKHADPTTGLWDYLAAVEYSLCGDAENARSYAKLALRHDLPAEARRQCVKLAGS